MRNSTIKLKTGQCIDCSLGRTSFLTADRCPSHYKVHRAKIGRAKAEAKPRPVKTVSIKPTKRVSNLFDKSLEQLKEIAQDDFNAWIRKRDAKDGYFVCISCNTPKSLSQMDAGHYYSRGNHSFLRYNENNVHGQCRKCNSFMSGHLIPYRENLIIKIGIDKVEELDKWRNATMHWDKMQVIGIIQLYREKLKKDFL